MIVSFTNSDGNKISIGSGPVTVSLGDGVSVTYGDGTYVRGDRYSFKTSEGVMIDRRRYPGEGNRVARRTAAKGQRRAA